MTNSSLPQSKKCTKCGQVKALSEFGKKKNGVRAHCKSCHNKEGRRYYKRNSQAVIARTVEYNRRWRTKNPDEARERDRRSNHKRYWKNPKGMRAYNRNYYKDNTDKFLYSNRRRRALKQNATIGYVPTKEEMLQEQNYCCCYCGRNEYEITPHTLGYIWAEDHIIPLSRGGQHVWWNIAVACWQCNSSKSDKLLNEWEVPSYKK